MVIILDSSLLVGAYHPGDAHHEEARRVLEELKEGRWEVGLVPEYVFLETTTVLSARAGQEAAVEAGNAILEAEDTHLVPCSDLFLDAYETFRLRPRNRWSFTDAAIVTLARERPPEEGRVDGVHVGTFDTDFEDVRGITVVPS